MRRFFRVMSIGLLFIGVGIGNDPLFSAPAASAADETILLEESQIKGEEAPAKEARQNGAPADRPALATDLPWGTEGERESLNIAQEIFDRLTQAAPSFLSMQGFESQEGEFYKGD